MDTISFVSVHYPRCASFPLESRCSSLRRIFSLSIREKGFGGYSCRSCMGFSSVFYPPLIGSSAIFTDPSIYHAIYTLYLFVSLWYDGLQTFWKTRQISPYFYEHQFFNWKKSLLLLNKNNYFKKASG